MRSLWTRVCLIFALTLPAFASLTTITQTVKGPDGNPANGTAQIRITAACANGSDYIGLRTISVPITSGTFSVQLVPTDGCPTVGTATGSGWDSGTNYNSNDRAVYFGGIYLALAANTNVPPAGPSGIAIGTWQLISPTYTVTYNITGGQAYSESWAVPTSGSPLTIDQVRISQANIPSMPGPPGPQGPAGSLNFAGTQVGVGYCIVPDNLSANPPTYHLATTGCPGGGGGGGLTLLTLTNPQLLSLNNSQLSTLGN